MPKLNRAGPTYAVAYDQAKRRAEVNPALCLIQVTWIRSRLSHPFPKTRRWEPS